MSEKNIKRSRAPNFTQEEQLLLFSAMKPYTQILECKKTDSTKQIDKQNAWSQVTDIYNANTKGVKRTTENLISCYRNFKSKLKKQHSEAKMLLEDPSKKEALLNAIEDHGKDWAGISTVIDTPADICQSSFEELQKIVKKEEAIYKKQILGTGGGPPPSNEDPLMTIKKLIEPQIDGMYTIYDGDADLMDQFQKTKPAEERVLPVEYEFLRFNKENTNPDNSTSGCTDTVLPITPSVSDSCTDNNQETGDNMTPPALKMKTPRTDFLRKKRAPELGNGYDTPSKKRRNINDSFLNLSQEKVELVKMQKKKLEMEMQHLSKLHALELELLEIKIKNEKQK